MGVEVESTVSERWDKTGEDKTYNTSGDVERSVEPEDLVDNGVEVVQPRAIRELFPSRVRVRELFFQLLAEALLGLWLARQLDESPLAFMSMVSNLRSFRVEMRLTVRLTGAQDDRERSEDKQQLKIDPTHLK